MNQSQAESGNFPPLELWGGLEPTINRVNDQYFDQDSRTAHSERPQDLDKFASLGIKAIRYPVLWEATAPDGLEKANWHIADERLSRIRELGIRPIVGLVHHGSGPRHTSLIDPDFPDKLAEYAKGVAERFPWVEDYTPINEPMTTARFSGLYGFWYPHGKDDATFLRALVTECKGVLRAMRAIRTVNPAARLIHTDDYGKTFGTRQLNELVEFTNERRWLGLDLLFGRIREDHPMWRYLLDNGITEDDVQEFIDAPCPPDVLGINFYITSERFYDHRLDRYPAEMQSEEQGQRYVNLDVSRILVEGMSGYGTLLPEVWERYGKPMAITETHIGSLRDEDLRWLWYIWQEAQRVREQGVEVQAVTMWALLGTYNWASLLTKDTGQYEPGAFDVRAPEPRPTALVRLARDLSAGRQPDIPVLDTPGWWKRWERLEYPPYRLHTQSDYIGARLTHEPGPTGRPLLIVGGGGQLGRCFLRMCTQRGLSWRTLIHSELDIADPVMLENALNLLHPWAVINTAGMNNPDAAQQQPELAKRVLSDGAATLAAACAARNIPLVTFSSDQVFDGKKKDKYVESDPTTPLSVFGRYLAEGEERALTIWSKTLVMRMGVHFSPYEERNPVTHALNALAAGQPFNAADDCIVTGSYAIDLCNDTLDLLIDQEVGIWHHGHPQAMSYLELYRLAAHITGIDSSRLEGRPMAEIGLLAPRPLYSALGSERGVLPPPLEQALARYCADCQVGWVTKVAEEDRCRNAPESPKMG